MEGERDLDLRENVRVVTSNNFIMSEELQRLSLNARKLLYLAISQCKKKDEGFYSYSISLTDFADEVGISTSTLYGIVRDVTRELLSLTIFSKYNEENESFVGYAVFSRCSYNGEKGEIYFKLNPDMTEFLLGLKENFSKPLLSDFMKMKGKYSIPIWHLFQMKMNSAKPKGKEIIEFDCSLDELKQVTDVYDKYSSVGSFKQSVLDPALKYISEACMLSIFYKNKKRGRVIVGFTFRVMSIFTNIIEQEGKSEKMLENSRENNNYTRSPIDELRQFYEENDIENTDFPKQVLSRLGITNRDPANVEVNIIEGWLSCGYSEELILAACDKAILYNPKSNLLYVNSVLENWERKSVRNLSDVKTDEEDFATRKMKQKSEGKRGGVAKVNPNGFANFNQSDMTEELNTLEKMLADELNGGK